MHLLFYNHAPELGGAERSLLAIMQHALRAGYEVTLCAPPGPLLEAATRDGITSEEIAPLVLGYSRSPFLMARYLAGAAQPIGQLAAAINRTRPDLVHANSIRSGLIAATARRLSRPHPRLAVHIRDALGMGPADRLVALALSRHTDGLIAISRYVAAPFLKDVGHVQVLHNAIDPRRYRENAEAGQAFRRRLGVPEGALLLAVAGQLTPWKGQQDALEAFALVRQALADAHLLIAGSARFTGKHRRYDTVAYEMQLRARAAQPDLVNSVHFSGEISDAAIIYSAASLLLVPSWREPFGRVVIEAMAAGCPVLASNAGGIPEIIRHGVDGWLVPPRDPQAMACAIVELQASPDRRVALAQEGRISVETRFSLNSYWERLEHIWHNVLRLEPEDPVMG